MLARVEEPAHVAVVQVVERRDVHEVDVIVIGEPVGALVCATDSVSLGELGGGGLVTG